MDIQQLQRQVAGLSSLVSLQARVQDSATRRETLYRIVNETAVLVPYDQALLFNADHTPEAVSDLPQPDANAPFLVWAGKLAGELARNRTQTGPVDPAKLSDDLRAEWDKWLPAHALWIQLPHPRHGSQGGMLLVRPTPFSEDEATLCAHLGKTFGHALGGFVRPASAFKTRLRSMLQNRRRTLAFVALLLVIGLVVPVRLTGVGAAEVVADNPAVLRSPLDGVVAEVLVQPNELVAEGQAVLRLDDRDLLSRLVLARQALATAQAELRQYSQAALMNPESKWHLSMARAQVEERKQQLAHIQDLLERTEIVSPRSGIAIFNDADEMVGVPVRVGQKLLAVCGEQESKLRVWLPVNDAVALETGAHIRLFLNVDPDTSVSASLVSAGFTAEPSPDGVLSYRVLARFDEEADRPRIGLRGLGIVSGERVPLLYSLLRRPYGAVRRWLGW